MNEKGKVETSGPFHLSASEDGQMFYIWAPDKGAIAFVGVVAHPCQTGREDRVNKANAEMIVRALNAFAVARHSSQPVAWLRRFKSGGTDITTLKERADEWREVGSEVADLYTSPPPQQQEAGGEQIYGGTALCKHGWMKADCKTCDPAGGDLVREAAIQECIEIARRYDDCGADFIIEKMQESALSVSPHKSQEG